MKKPVITVIVPVYMVEQYIHKCIDSILAQTFTDFELILVDDGSTDNCPLICDEYAKKDSRIVVIHKKNEGLSGARNAALDIAKGKYISFVDSDDYVSNVMFQTMLDEIEKNQCDVCICNNWRVENNGIFADKNTLSQKIYSKEDIMKIVLADELGSQSWRYMFKQIFWEDIRFPVGRRFEDIATTYLVIHKIENAIYIGDKLYFYLIRDSGISYTQGNLNAIHIYQGFKERFEFSKKYYPQFSDITLALVVQHALNLYNSRLSGLNQLVEKELMQEIHTTLISEYKNIIYSKKILNSTKVKIVILRINQNLYNFIYKLVKLK